MKSVMTGKSSLSENYDTNTLVVLAWKTGNRSLLFHWQWVSAFQLPFAQKMFPRGISYLPKSDSWRQCLGATHTLQQKDYLTNDYLNSLLAAKYVAQFFRFFVLAWSYVKWSVILMVPQKSTDSYRWHKRCFWEAFLIFKKSDSWRQYLGVAYLAIGVSFISNARQQMR